MAKSVEIVISADDKATSKFKQVEKSMQATSKTFKESAGRAKASTEIVGALATVTAGSSSALSGFAGELAMVTERLSAFSEVADEGGAGALAFKAGILAAAGALAFKLGKALGDVIFQTEKLKRQFEDLKEEAQRLDDALAENQSSRFADDLAELERIEDLEQRRLAALEKQGRVDADIQTKLQQISALKEKIAGRTETWTGWAASAWGEYSKTTESLEQQLQTQQMLLEGLRDQSKELSQAVTEEDRIAAAAEKARKEKEEQLEIEKKLAAEKKKAAEEAARQAEQEKRERISSARQFIAEQQRAREELARLTAPEEDRGNAGLNATTGRLLTRSQDQGYPAKTAKNTEKIAELQDRLNQNFEDFLRQQEAKDAAAESLALTVVE